MAARKSTRMPGKLTIARYWILKDKRKLFPEVYWERVGCFACGYFPGCFSLAADLQSGKVKRTIDQLWANVPLERCHLVARADGGTDEVDNLVLLCKRCHRTAPMVGIYWRPMVDWINRRESYFNTFMPRALAELRAVSATLPEDVCALGLSHEEILESFNEMIVFLKLGYHPGGEMIPTIAAALNAMVQLDGTVRKFRHGRAIEQVTACAVGDRIKNAEALDTAAFSVIDEKAVDCQRASSGFIYDHHCGVRLVIPLRPAVADNRSPMGRLIVGLVAEFERALIAERIAVGVKKSRAYYAAGRIGKDKHTRSGKDLPAGRPRRIFRRDEAEKLRELGWSWRAIERHLGVSASTLRGALRGK